MREMLKTMRQRLLAGEELVMVTVIASSGATPRGAGARMLVGKEGRVCGTIGGGAVEYRSEKIAGEVLREKNSRGHDFTLTKDDVQNLGMICGGACNVFFHYLSPERRPSDRRLVDLNHLVEVLHPRHLAMLAGLFLRSVKVIHQDRLQRLVDQCRFAGAADARHDREGADRDARGDVLQVVLGGAGEGEHRRSA